MASHTYEAYLEAVARVDGFITARDIVWRQYMASTDGAAHKALRAAHETLGEQLRLLQAERARAQSLYLSDSSTSAAQRIEQNWYTIGKLKG